MFSSIKYIIIKSDKLIRAAKNAINNNKISFILLSIVIQFFTTDSVYSLECTRSIFVNSMRHAEKWPLVVEFV